MDNIKPLNGNDGLLTYLISEFIKDRKGWFGYKQQKITGITLIHAIAANHADKMTPAEIVEFVLALNDEVYSGFFKKE